MLFTILPTEAQAVSWTQSDIGTTGATGTNSFSSGTYTVTGAGSGVGSTADSFSFLKTSVGGNVEMIGRVATQSNTNNYATAGFMVRSSLNADAANAFVSVSPANGVNFSARSANGGTTATTLGPTIVAPVFLRIVVSGTSIAGYQSSDGINWVMVGKTQMSMPSVFYIGFAVCSNVTGTLSTATFNSVSLMTNVPQRSSSMQLWLRSDVGLQYSGSAVTGWQDQSGNGFSAFQNTSGNRPTLNSGAINGLPAVGFNGTSQFLQLPSGLANFTQGATTFIVTKPTAVPSAGPRFFDFGNGAVSNNIIMNASTTTQAQYAVASGGTLSSIYGTMSLNQYQLLESVQNSAGVATLYQNGTQTGTGTLYTITNVTRTQNYIGTSSTNQYLTGQIAELIVFNAALTTQQRKAVEAYAYGKYGIGTAPQATTPTISPAAGVYAQAQSVTISADPGATVFYTTNGTTPTSSSAVYTGPFTVSSSTTVKSMATAANFTDSAVSSNYIQIDATTASVSRSGMMLWLKSDNGVVTSGSNVTQWADVSGNANHALQNTSTNQPTFVASAVNGLPAITFGAGNQWLQMPTGFSNFVPGASVFIVAKPTTTGTGNIVALYSPGPSDQLTVQQANGQLNFYCQNGGTMSSVSSGASAVTINQYQLIEATHSGAGTAKVYVNGVVQGQGTVQNFANVSRTLNYIGDGGSAYTGGIAEILVYNRQLTSAELTSVQGYLHARFALKVSPPTITPDSGVYASAQAVSITADPGASIFYTLDGTQPTTASTPYTGSFTISSSTSPARPVQAIAVQSFGTSAVASSYIQIDSTTAAVNRNGLLLWLKADNGAQTALSNGASVSTWSDSSTSKYDATQATAANKPTLTTSAINGLPAITFNGTTQLLQMPSGFSNFSAGASVFMIMKPTSTGTGNAIALYNGGPTDQLTLEQANRQLIFFAQNGGSLSSVSSGTTALTLNQYQLVEATHDGAGSASVFVNGVLQAQGAVQNFANLTRGFNYIGDGGAYFTGSIAEVLVFDHQLLTAAERLSVEGYLEARYALKVNPPTITPDAGIFAGSQSVSMTADPGASIYYTTNGTTPTTGSTLYTAPFNVSSSTSPATPVKAIAVQSFGTSAVASAYIQIDGSTLPVPRNGLKIWLKSDNGVQATLSNGSSASTWTDSSINRNNATQATGTAQPTFSTNVINGLPALIFNGTTQTLTFPAGFENFSGGATIFVVAKPQAASGTGQLFSTYGNGPIDWLSLGTSGTNVLLRAYNGGASSSLSTTNTPITLNTYQLVEGVHDGTSTATIFVNGVQKATGSVQSLRFVSRGYNSIASAVTVEFFQGGISEVICYNRPLSDSERKSVEGYLSARYALAVSAPVISPTTGTYSAAQSVSITADPGATIRYTTDGSQPTGTSTLYSAPFTISTTTTVKAIAIQSFATSAVSSSFIQIDPGSGNVSKTGLMLWLKSDMGVTTSGTNITQWSDISGSNNNASQSTTGAQPTLVTGAINSLPAASFNGTNQTLTFPTGFANFSAGASIFIVAKPASVSGTRDMFSAYVANPSDWISLGTSGANIFMRAYNGLTSGSLATSNTPVTTGAYKIFEGMHNGSTTGTLFLNATQQAQGIVQTLQNVSRTYNSIGSAVTVDFFQGEIAEVIAYNRAISPAERMSAERYLTARYALGVSTPVITPATGVYDGTQTVNILADPGATIKFTTDGTTPTGASPVFTSPFTISSAAVIKAIAIQSFGTSAVASSYIQLDGSANGVSRSGLLVWLKSDNGVQAGLANGAAVSTWSDSSGNGNDATQSSSTSKPLFLTNAIDGLPSVSFNGTAHTLQLPAALSNFSSGATIFAVTKPLAATGTRDIFTAYTPGAPAADEVALQTTGNNASFVASNSTTTSSVSTTDNSVGMNKYQVLEALHNGSTTGTIYVDAVQHAQGTVQSLRNIARTVNNVGSAQAGNFFQGELAELLVYNRPLTAERPAVESYLLQRYQTIYSAVNAPSFSIASGTTLSAPSQVAITGPVGASIFFTIDGTTPTSSSTAYTGPINVYYTQTIKAIAIVNGLTSSVSSATYTLNSTTWPAPNPSDTTPLQIKLLLPTNSIP